MNDQTATLGRVYLLGQADEDTGAPVRTVAELRDHVGIAADWLPDTAIENMYLHGRAGTEPAAINVRRHPGEP